MVFKWILNQGEKSQKEKMPFFFFLNKKERKRMMKSGLIRESFRWRINTRERVIGPDPQRSYFLEKKRIYILPYSIDSGFSLNIIFKIFLKKKKRKKNKKYESFLLYSVLYSLLILHDSYVSYAQSQHNAQDESKFKQKKKKKRKMFNIIPFFLFVKKKKKLNL